MYPITGAVAHTIDQQHRERLTQEYAAARRTSEGCKRGFHALLSLLDSHTEPVVRGSARHA
ncbi:hypothetical protein [Allobranchiibius sp. GilTou73]|uniref:hypothetical protein n=1 Tax=Allobranchiibius sp. GilTou73 TaxID=2904523 RepID=UPI001F1F45E8|nr:hypothetical protein [Allobranchiibius sp. GilTou73]UIJ34530.1 hypothetical protein LVQ62_15695 [Allobranchiibius sp. GilTou73]